MYDNTAQPKIMRDRYAQLPSEITELFEYGTVDHVIDLITTEFGLNEEQKSLLRMEIEMVLYLFVPQDGFKGRVQESLEVDEIRASGITQKVTSDLFYIVDDLLKFTEEQFAGAEEEANSLIVTAPIDKSLEPLPTNSQSKNEIKLENPTLVKPLRTFAMDVDVSRAHGYGAFQSGEVQNDEDEPVHSSNQDDILKK